MVGERKTKILWMGRYTNHTPSKKSRNVQRAKKGKFQKRMMTKRANSRIEKKIGEKDKNRKKQPQEEGLYEEANLNTNLLVWFKSSFKTLWLKAKTGSSCSFLGVRGGEW